MNKLMFAVASLVLAAVLVAEENTSIPQPGGGATSRLSASQPVPSAADQQKAKQGVLDFIKSEKSDTPAEKRAIIEKMIESANGSADAARKYVLLSMAMERAREIGAPDLVPQAWLALRKGFETGDPELTNAARAVHFNATAVTHSLTVLATNPADANANTVVGICCAFYLDDWEKGLPLLYKSDNPAIAAAANAEMDKPTDATKLKDLANAWLAIGARQGETASGIIRRHALGILNQALEQADPVAKPTIQKALDALLKSMLPEQKLELLGTWHVSIGKETVDWTFLENGTITSAHHGPPDKGKWSIEGSKVKVQWKDGAEWETLNLPINSGQLMGESWNDKKVTASRQD